MHKIKITKSNLEKVEAALNEAERKLNYALDLMGDKAEDDDEDKCDGDHPLLQVSQAHTNISESIRDLKDGFKVITGAKVIEASDAEVTQAFEDAHKSLKDHGWGTEDQIKTQNKAFDLAKEKGWDWESDSEFTTYALKATVEEILDKGLECYLKHTEEHET